MIAALALGTVVAASSAAAQGTGTTSTAAVDQGVTFGVGGGIAIPSGDMSSVVKTGFNVTGMLGFNPAMLPFGLRADVSYNRFGFDSNKTGGVTGNSSLFGGALNGLFKLPAASITPYVLAGPGFYHVSASADNGGGSTSENKFAVQGGAGIQANLAGMTTHLEAKIVNIFTSGSSARFFPITVGIMFGGGLPTNSQSVK
jgi:hypothetical protein